MMKIWQKDGAFVVTNEEEPKTTANDATPEEQDLTKKVERLEQKLDEVLKEAKTSEEDKELMQRLKNIKGTGIR